MFGSFFKFRTGGGEYGKHTDIVPTCQAIPEQTWLEYKQLTNDQNAYQTVYGENKKHLMKRLEEERRREKMMQNESNSPRDNVVEMSKSVSVMQLGKNASVTESQTMTTMSSEESTSSDYLRKSKSLQQ